MDVRSRVVAEAIEQWYTANYPRGVRLTFGQRAALAESINYRLDLVESVEAPISQDDDLLLPLDVCRCVEESDCPHDWRALTERRR